MRPVLNILIVGFGDIGTRVARLLLSRPARFRITALVRNQQSADLARSLGAIPVFADLGKPQSLQKLAGNYACVFHFAPPPAEGAHDKHTRYLLAALSRPRAPRMLTQPVLGRLVYISTTGVYGNCHGECMDETRPLRPATDRAKRRVDAESVLRTWGQRTGIPVTILRVPGIYADDRLPLERLRKGTPALRREEDVFTNHIHADDLARATIAAMWLGKSGRAINVVDDSVLTMGDYFDAVADAFKLPRPPRISRHEAQAQISPALLSFMSESRRIRNNRMKNDLRLQLRHPTVEGFLKAKRPK
jgi:nucleoside-diphosphate-sugar epimerase